MTDVLRPVVNVFSFVDDLEAATAWYTARLGASPAITDEQLVMFEVGAARLTLHRIDEFNAGGPGGQVAYWDVDARRRRAGRRLDRTRRGRAPRPEDDLHGERLCQVLDPFGNLVGLRQAPPVQRRGNRHLGRRPHRGRGHLA